MTAPGTRGDGSTVIVVVNWNGADLLPACLEGAFAQDYSRPFEVIVVDNLSTDGSVDLVRRDFPRARMLVNDVNNYCRANNRGAAATASEFVALLNTDATLAPDWLRRLAACLDTDLSAGAVTGLVRFPDGRINSTGIESLPRFHWRDRDFGAAAHQVPPAGPVEGVSGCAVLWRRQCWDRLGGLDEDFEMYYEDVDVSLRAVQAGWRLLFCPEAVATHRYNATIQKRERLEGKPPGAALKDVLGERNRLFVLARHFAPAFAAELAASRYFTRNPDGEVAAALDVALQKWALGRLEPGVRRGVGHALLACRSALLAREAWAHQNLLEVGKRERQVLQLMASLEALEASSQRLRSEQHRHIEHLDRLARAADDRLGAADARCATLERALAEARANHEVQFARDAAELVHTRAALQREIASRDATIAALLAEREADLAHRAADRERPPPR